MIWLFKGWLRNDMNGYEGMVNHKMRCSDCVVIRDGFYLILVVFGFELFYYAAQNVENHFLLIFVLKYAQSVGGNRSKRLFRKFPRKYMSSR